MTACVYIIKSYGPSVRSYTIIYNLIYAFWTSNGSIKLKIFENGNIHVIMHDVDLEELFPNNELIKDIQKVQILLIKVRFVFLNHFIVFNVQHSVFNI